MCFRFTELFVDELEDTSDLRILVAEYLKGLSLTVAQLDGIVNFYLTIRSEVSKKLTDGTGHRPHYRFVWTLAQVFSYSTCVSFSQISFFRGGGRFSLLFMFY